MGQAEFKNEPSGELMNMDSLRQELKRLRKIRNLTQITVAESLGIKQAALSAFERGYNKTMRKETLDKVMELVQEWRGSENIVRMGLPPAETTSEEAEDEPSRSENRDARADEIECQQMREIIAKRMGNTHWDVQFTLAMTGEELRKILIVINKITI